MKITPKKLEEKETKAHKQIRDAKSKAEVLKGLKADEKVDKSEKKMMKKGCKK